MDLRRHGPLATCLLLSAASFLIPFRTGPAANPPPDPPPPIPPHASRAETTLRLGNAGQVRVGLSPAILPLDADSELQVAMELSGNEPAQRSSRALVVCLDRSGSMNGGNIERAREAAQFLVRSLSDDDEIAIVTFATHPEIAVPLQRADENGRAAALQAIAGLSARGGTNLSGGLANAIRLASDGRSAVRRVILVSDGVPTEGDTRSTTIVNLARQAAGSGVVVSTLGVGSQSPGGLMERVAVSAGGFYRFLRDGSGLKQALALEIEQTGKVAAQDTIVRLTLPDGVTLRSAHGVIADAKSDVIEMRLGDLVAGRTRHIHLRLAVPASARNGVNLAVNAQARAGGTPLQAMDEVSATTSSDAAAVARSTLPWVETRGTLALASEEIRSAAKDLSDGDATVGRKRLQVLAGTLGRAAASQPALAEPARQLRALADEAEADSDRGAMSNKSHAQAFELAY